MGSGTVEQGSVTRCMGAIVTFTVLLMKDGGPVGKEGGTFISAAFKANIQRLTENVEECACLCDASWEGCSACVEPPVISHNAADGEGEANDGDTWRAGCEPLLSSVPGDLGEGAPGCRAEEGG